MDLFTKKKGQPIKLRGFDFIGYHKDYNNCCYYIKKLPSDNFEIMETMLEGYKKPELGAGTKIQVLDTFMSNYLYFKKNKIEYKDNKEFISKCVDNSFADLEEQKKEDIKKQFTSKLPVEVRGSELYKKYTNLGYELLYCSNDESDKRLMAIVNIVLVKEDHIVSNDAAIDIDRTYTLFKPLKFMVTPGYIQKKSKVKYFEEDVPQIVINNDLLD